MNKNIKSLIYDIAFIHRKRTYDIRGFLMGNAPDYKGRYFNGILKRSNNYLEKCHTYIQFIFPIDKRSSYSLFAPVVTISEAEELGKDPVIRENMRKAVKRMMDFYAETNWITRNNHNYLRISRILRSLRLFHLDAEADEFYDFITKIADKHTDVITTKTRGYWERNNEKVPREIKILSAEEVLVLSKEVLESYVDEELGDANSFIKYNHHRKEGLSEEELFILQKKEDKLVLDFALDVCRAYDQNKDISVFGTLLPGYIVFPMLGLGSVYWKRGIFGGYMSIWNEYINTLSEEEKAQYFEKYPLPEYMKPNVPEFCKPCDEKSTCYQRIYNRNYPSL